MTTPAATLHRRTEPSRQPPSLVRTGRQGRPARRSRPGIERWQVLLVAALAALVVDLALGGWAVDVDRGVHALPLPRPAWSTALAGTVDHVGLGVVDVSGLLALAAVVALRLHRWRPVLLVLTALPALYAVVWSAKALLGRGRPVDGVVTLFSGGQSLPSGHAANVAFAAVLVVHLLGLLRGRRFPGSVTVGAVGAASAVMAATSLFLGFHWLSDLVAGTLVGLLVGCTAVHLDERPASVPATRSRPKEQDLGRTAPSGG